MVVPKNITKARPSIGVSMINCIHVIDLRIFIHLSLENYEISVHKLFQSI